MERIAKWLDSIGVTPNQMTLTGGIFCLAGGIVMAVFGNFLWALALGLAGGFCDLLDGIISRICNKGSAFGAFFDSVVDRYSDFFLFAGVLFHYVRTGEYIVVCLCILVILGSVVTSYAKARMEGFGIECKVGLLERSERLAILGVGGLFPVIMPIALLILAVLSNITAVQRILFGKKALLK